MAMFDGMFGTSGPGGVSKMQILAAMLSDLGANYQGRPSTMLPMMAQKREQADQYDKFLGMIGGGSQPQPPAMPPAPMDPTLTDTGMLPPAPPPQAPGGMIGAGPQMGQMMQMLRSLPPEIGMQIAPQMLLAQMPKPQEPLTPKDRYQVVPGVGLVDLAAQDGPQTAIAQPTETKPPPFRTRREGGNDVNEEYVNGKWVKVGQGSHFAPTAPDKPTAAPAGYRYAANGNLEFIPGGPADPAKGAGRKAPTEDQAKNMQLYERASQQASILLGDGKTPGVFDSLAHASSQIGNLTGLAAATSPEFQRADAALTDLAASYLYSVSGATANPGEVQNLARTLRPRIGESATSVADKKARIKQMVDSIKTRAAGAIPQEQPQATSIDALVNKYLGGQ